MNIVFPPLDDKDEERKRALAKIYALLIKLADEVKNRTTSSEINSNEQKITQTISVPLQKNIPS